MLFNSILVCMAIAILWKTASWFVEGATGVAALLRVPKMLIGLVLVSLATTAPELFTSLIATLHGYPEMALGNAIGSVIVDASVALGLAALLASTPLSVDPSIFRISARTVLIVLALAFVLVMDGVLQRYEGMLLLGAYALYVIILYRHFRTRQKCADFEALLAAEGVNDGIAKHSWRRVSLLFLVGLTGVLFGSELLVRGATELAATLGLSPVVIGLTVTALGTSMPEIATCIASALKRESAIGVGNIIGADILNVCWVAGASSLANPLTAEKSVLFYMFPAALIIVGSMVGMLRMGYSLNRWNGAVLASLFIAYAAGLYLLLTFGP